MSDFTLMKVFDIDSMPNDVQEEFLELMSDSGDYTTYRVSARTESGIDPWLLQHGAIDGERVLLYYSM